MSELTAETPAELTGFTAEGFPVVEEADKVEAPAVEAETTPAEQPSGDSEDTFMPQGEVTPGLESQYKSMQGAFTRKMQEMAERGKGLEESSQKAVVLDQLMGNPGFRKLLAGVRDGTVDLDALVSGQPAPQDPEETPVEPDVKAYVDSRVQEVENKTRAEQTKLSAQLEAKEFVTKHSDWETHRAGMSKAWARNEGLTMEDAYKIARFEGMRTQLNGLNQQLQSLRGEKRVTMSTEPGTVTRGAPAPKQADSVAEAAASALEELRTKGMRFRV